MPLLASSSSAHSRQEGDVKQHQGSGDVRVQNKHFQTGCVKVRGREEGGGGEKGSHQKGVQVCGTPWWCCANRSVKGHHAMGAG